MTPEFDRKDILARPRVNAAEVGGEVIEHQGQTTTACRARYKTNTDGNLLYLMLMPW